MNYFLIAIEMLIDGIYTPLYEALSQIPFLVVPFYMASTEINLNMIICGMFILFIFGVVVYFPFLAFKLLKGLFIK